MEYKIFSPEEYLENLGIEGVKVKDLVMSPSETRTIGLPGCTGLDGAVMSWQDVRPQRVPEIREVIFDDPATIIFWKDGTKTVVRAHDEEFSKEHGLAMAIARKYFHGKRGRFLRAVEKGKVKDSKARKAEKAKKKPSKKAGKKAAKKASKKVKN